MRLVTYNIHKGIGGSDRRYDLDRIVEVLVGLNADFLCLQEVTLDLPRTQRHDQAGILDQRFDGMQSIFQQNVKWKVGGYGNMLISRWPMVEHHRVSLRFRERKPRGAQWAIVQTPAGSIRLVNWHLGLSQIERQWQVDHLLRQKRFGETHSMPSLIAGDFNDWRNLLGKTVLEPGGFKPVASPPSHFRSFPAVLPVMSLDKVFVRGPIEVTAAHVVRTKLARQASDHLPLAVDFELRSAR